MAYPPTVLVTGSATRLGREIALSLARAGWRVAVHYRNSTEDAIKTVAACADFCSGSSHFYADLSKEADCKALLPQVIAKLGHVDAVVNSASLVEHDDVHSFGFDALHKHLAANTGAPIVLAQALHAHVVQRRAAAQQNPQTAEQATKVAPQGVVVNLLDQKLWSLNPDFLSYTLSKAALEAANTMLAMALAPQVRVVGVAPGLTLKSQMISDEKFETLHQWSPLGRSSTPQDVCTTVLFALQNQSITGTTLLVDGGQHLMKLQRDIAFFQQASDLKGSV
jgi:NAD(P)-dependent dehydrogenase (short-subunit alcohol dehydrogenase family)